nr:hypothetical protein BaRGS_015776 [Batillaria attramentaria]
MLLEKKVQSVYLLIYCSFSNLTGTPPDLTLTVRLDNVRKEEEGQWRLELTNDAGQGHVDFFLHVNEQSKQGENIGYIIGGVIGSFLFTGAVIVAVIILKKKREAAKRVRASKYQYPIGNAERILMRPVSTLAIRDPSYNAMASHGCHVTKKIKMPKDAVQ